MIKDIEIRHAHLFCGIGGGARGFNKSAARLGNLRAKFRGIGGIDVDAGAVKGFERLAGVPGTVIDLFSLEQYRNFHGKEPPAGWREATPDDIRRAFGYERPHILFMSPPCKGFSGLLSQAKSESGKYQALNALTLRGVWLALEAFKDDPVDFMLLENVPRIQTRGRPLLDRIIALLHAYGYATAETTHDCGKLGNLAQSRKRFLMVARHQEKVPAFLYQAPVKPLRAVGEVLGRFPLPGDPAAGAMHRSPALQWKTWVRLAFVEAGSDWRSLKKLRVENGVLADYLIVPELFRGAYGVTPWTEPAATVTSKNQPSCTGSVADPRAEAFHGAYGAQGWDEPSRTITSQSLPSGGTFGIADPRFEAGKFEGGQLGVRRWDEHAPAITCQRAPGQGGFSVADPRVNGHDKSVQMGVRAWDQCAGVVTGKMFAGGGPNSVADPRLLADGRFNNVYRIVSWSETSPAVTAGTGPTAGGIAVADPRGGDDPDALHGKYRVTGWDEASRAVIAGRDNGASVIADPRTGFGEATHHNVLHVTPWDESAKTITSGNHPSGGALSVADPRPRLERERGDDYRTAGHYGVVPWTAPSYAVTAHARHDNGHGNVADPRIPGAADRLVCVIVARDNTWHRPFTTLELAALQGLVEPEEHLVLEGLSDSQWREWIGNAVPDGAARAIGSVMGRALLGAWSGETFLLASEPVWVRPVAIALSLSRAL